MIKAIITYLRSDPRPDRPRPGFSRDGRSVPTGNVAQGGRRNTPCVAAISRSRGPYARSAPITLSCPGAVSAWLMMAQELEAPAFSPKLRSRSEPRRYREPSGGHATLRHWRRRGQGTIAAIQALLANIATLPDALICRATNGPDTISRIAIEHSPRNSASRSCGFDLVSKAATRTTSLLQAWKRTVRRHDRPRAPDRRLLTPRGWQRTGA